MAPMKKAPMAASPKKAMAMAKKAPATKKAPVMKAKRAAGAALSKGGLADTLAAATGLSRKECTGCLNSLAEVASKQARSPNVASGPPAHVERRFGCEGPEKS